VRHLPRLGPGIGDEEDPVALDDDRRGDQGDQQRARDDGFGLKAEQQQHGQE